MQVQMCDLCGRFRVYKNGNLSCWFTCSIPVVIGSLTIEYMECEECKESDHDVLLSYVPRLLEDSN